MKRILTSAFIAGLALIAGFVVLKLTVPLSYAEAELRLPAVEFVIGLQKISGLVPMECATRYLYFNTDYHNETPERIRITEKLLSENRVRITLHDPSCHDDSTHSLISRIYLERNDNGFWIPVRHEWSHTGRGRFGWTTKPTN